MHEVGPVRSWALASLLSGAFVVTGRRRSALSGRRFTVGVSAGRYKGNGRKNSTSLVLREAASQSIGLIEVALLFGL